jgi:hypothetical protein
MSTTVGGLSILLFLGPMLGLLFGCAFAIASFMPGTKRNPLYIAAGILVPILLSIWGAFSSQVSSQEVGVRGGLAFVSAFVCAVLFVLSFALTLLVGAALRGVRARIKNSSATSP